jgi:hypothetical protein
MEGPPRHKTMKILHTAQDAIEQAIEGGWKPSMCRKSFNLAKDGVWEFEGGRFSFGHKEDIYRWSVSYEEIFTDPLFWQALGKARGWNDGTHRAGNGELTSIAYWRRASIGWFENRMAGGDETKFWESLS